MATSSAASVLRPPLSPALRHGRAAIRLLVRTLLRRRRLRRAVIASLALAFVLPGGWLWFRDSSLVAITHVEVRGASGPDAAAIRAALRRAARQMSTLDLDQHALQAAVASYPEVRGVRAVTAFPHGLRVRVVEELPVATLVAPSGARTAVAVDGTVLGTRLVAGALPAIPVPELPARAVSDHEVIGYLAVLGAAPAPLAPLIERVYSAAPGITVELHSGLLVYFGDASRPHAKWLSFARALLASEAQSVEAGSLAAAYVDVRLPERPAVGSTPLPSHGAASAASAEAASGASGASAQARLARIVAALQATVGGVGASEASSASPATSQQPSAEAGSAAEASSAGERGGGAAAGGGETRASGRSRAGEASAHGEGATAGQAGAPAPSGATPAGGGPSGGEAGEGATAPGSAAGGASPAAGG